MSQILELPVPHFVPHAAWAYQETVLAKADIDCISPMLHVDDEWAVGFYMFAKNRECNTVLLGIL